MIICPDNCVKLVEGLDHPESVCVGENDIIYSGGESGQLYEIDRERNVRVIATTGGFLLGLALDGDGVIHACDCDHGQVYAISAKGETIERLPASGKLSARIPNYAVFDQAGHLLVSDSGDYWNSEAVPGRILRIDSNNHVDLFHSGPFAFANGLAISPDNRWLYIVESRKHRIVRTLVERPQAAIEVTHEFPSGSVPDGIAFAADGTLVVGCYKPDAVFLGRPNGRVEKWLDDPTGELLNRPTNVALHDGKLIIANLGGWHLTMIDTDLTPMPLHKPNLGLFCTNG